MAKRKKKQKGWRKKLRGVWSDIAWTLPVSVPLVVVMLLESDTMVYIPISAMWGTISIAMLVTIALVWKNKTPDSIWEVILPAGIGFLAGFVIWLSGMAILLGVNYLFPRSASYQRTAVVYKTKVYHGRHPVHGIGLHFDNGTHFVWDAGYEYYYRFRVGDTCSVTMFKGFLGYDVIEHVEISAPIKRSRHLFLPPDKEVMPLRKPSTK